MLTEERYVRILDILGQKRSASVTELSRAIGTSESTIRRDLNYLHTRNKLIKIFGGAVLHEDLFVKYEEEIHIKKDRNQEAKRKIAGFAASLIKDGDCVYIDGGSSTLNFIPEFVSARDAFFITNSPGTNLQFVRRGFRSLLTGGELRIASDTLFGEDTMVYLQKFNFTKGFFGVDAVSVEGGFSTALPAAGVLKQMVIKRCQHAYVTADSSKFDALAAVVFANISEADIITNKAPHPRYKEFTQVYEVGI
jgi:DeoR family fructose operon transcriptional repressor